MLIIIIKERDQETEIIDLISGDNEIYTLRHVINRAHELTVICGYVNKHI